MTALEKLQAYLAQGRELSQVATSGPWQTQNGEMGAFAVVTGDRNTQPNKRRLVARVDLHRARPEEIHCDAIFIADARTRVEIYEKMLAILLTAVDFYGSENCTAIARAAALLPGEVR